MAQWTGQFSGLTHNTKVRDTEASLRRAVAAAAQASPEVRYRKVRPMHALAERLLAVRLKAVRARIAALTEPGKRRSDEVGGLEEKERQILAGGIEAILREFGADKETFGGAV
ncbi:MAG: hypothetical protein J0M24_27190 [Verrucomicrobia bacterium]|nr:hypothetical protein [Verrucomicrobiota bacterium]